MSFFRVFDVVSSAMTAQSVRLNTTASNIANADSVASSVDETYRARHPVFAAEFDQALGQQAGAKVRVAGIVEDQKPLTREYAPNHPMADKDGFIFRSNVNVVEEMANMISAQRSYQTSVQIADAAKQMMSKTLQLGQG